MMRFREFMQNREYKYVSVVYDDKSQILLRQWAQDNGFDLTCDYYGRKQDPSAFQFHTSLFFSSNQVVMPNDTRTESATEVFPERMDLFGPNEDIPVIRIASPGIKDIREIFEHEYGIVDIHARYNPHISVSYKKYADVSKIKVPDFRPTFDKIVTEALKP